MDYLDQYELKTGEVIKGLNLDVKVMRLYPFREDYCQAEVGDQFGVILIHIFGSELVAKIQKDKFLTLRNVKFKLDKDGDKILRADQGESTVDTA